MTKWKRMTVMAVVMAMGLMMALPSTAQEQPDPQTLLHQLQALQQQNQALQRQLQELQSQVSTLAQTQQEQAQEIEKAPEQAAKKAAEGIKIKLGGKESLTFKGFISSTFYAQDQNFAFGNGQNAEFPKAPEMEDNNWFMGGDVRNTRLTMAFDGPELQGWRAGALLETDFFGGFNGSGAFSHQQTHLRMRLGYVQLQKGRTKIRLGQDWSPLFGEWPVSTSHIAFPLGYGSAGYVGWRFPGFYLWQELSAPDAGTKIQLQAGVFEGSWSGPGNNVDGGTAGNVGFNPQVEARLNFSGKTSGGNAWKLYIVGHYDDKDLKGVGDINPDPPIDDSITGTAEEIGGSLKVGHFLIHGNAYFAKGTGQQFTAITQFGDISSWGAWLQLGYSFDDHWSLYGFYGVDDPDNDDVLEWVGSGGRMENEMFNLHLRYAIGQYWLGIEWLQDTVKNGPDEVETTGNQIALSALYKF